MSLLLSVDEWPHSAEQVFLYFRSNGYPSGNEPSIVKCTVARVTYEQSHFLELNRLEKKYYITIVARLSGENVPVGYYFFDNSGI